MGWLISLAVVGVGIGVFARARRRRHDQGALSEPVSGDWLAYTRSRWSDHHW